MRKSRKTVKSMAESCRAAFGSGHTRMEGSHTRMRWLEMALENRPSACTRSNTQVGTGPYAYGVAIRVWVRKREISTWNALWWYAYGVSHTRIGEGAYAYGMLSRIGCVAVSLWYTRMARVCTRMASGCVNSASLCAVFVQLSRCIDLGEFLVYRD